MIYSVWFLLIFPIVSFASLTVGDYCVCVHAEFGEGWNLVPEDLCSLLPPYPSLPCVCTPPHTHTCTPGPCSHIFPATSLSGVSSTIKIQLRGRVLHGHLADVPSQGEDPSLSCPGSTLQSLSPGGATCLFLFWIVRPSKAGHEWLLGPRHPARGPAQKRSLKPTAEGLSVCRLTAAISAPRQRPYLSLVSGPFLRHGRVR